MAGNNASPAPTRSMYRDPRYISWRASVQASRARAWASEAEGHAGRVAGSFAAAKIEDGEEEVLGRSRAALQGQLLQALVHAATLLAEARGASAGAQAACERARAASRGVNDDTPEAAYEAAKEAAYHEQGLAATAAQRSRMAAEQLAQLAARARAIVAELNE